MAGTKTWADGDAITAADLNGFVRDQWTTICTSGTRPSTTQTGRLIYETDTRRTLVWDGAAWAIVREDQWTTYTPTWTAATTNPTIGNGTISGRWRYTGPKTIDFDAWLVFGSTTTFGSGLWRLSIPTGTPHGGRFQMGAWFTGNGPHSGVAFAGSNAWVELHGGSVHNYVGPTTPLTWTSAMQLHVSMRGLELA